MSGSGPNHHLLSPDYWQGVDILNPGNFDGIEPNVARGLEAGEERAITRQLGKTLGSIAAGDRTEIRFNTGDEFQGDQLNDGSIVVMQRESLQRHEPQNYETPSVSVWGDGAWRLPFERPFVSFWMRHQTHESEGPNRHNAGLNIIYFPEERTLYSKELLWGSVFTRAGRRMLVLYGFTSTHLLRNGKVAVSNFLGELTQTVDLPLNIGGVDAQPTVPVMVSENRYNLYFMNRVLSIDIVHPAQGEGRQAGDSSSRSLYARLAAQIYGRVLPQPGTATATGLSS